MADTVRLIALLRGINVGKAKRVSMAQLRELLQGLGYGDVTTHLQSGNAVFTCRPGAAATADPLLDSMTDPSKHLVGFLGGEPKAEGVRTLAGMDFTPDEVRLIGREVFLWCPAGVLDSPFSKVAWDKLLGVPVTMRNWNTVTKLVELAQRSD